MEGDMSAVIGASNHSHYHRSRSFSKSKRYLRIWNGHKIDYRQAIQRPNIFQSPQLVERILRVEAEMQSRGLIPFVHATPAGLKVLRTCIDVTRFSDKKPFFTSLRTTSKPKHSCEFVAIQGRQNSFLLSTSYALTSGIKPLESAASWGFINHFGSRQNSDLKTMFDTFMESQKVYDTPQQKEYFSKKGWKLIRQYGRLQVGDFLVIGIPEKKLTEMAYDAKAYNIPTGRDIRSVAFEPEKHVDSLLQEGYHLATLILSDEVLDPQSGLVIIDTSNKVKVDAFCKTKMAIDDELLSIVTKKSSKFEREQFDARDKLDQEVEALVSDFARIRIGDTVSMDMPSFDEDFRSCDCPPKEF